MEETIDTQPSLNHRSTTLQSLSAACTHAYTPCVALLPLDATASRLSLNSCRRLLHSVWLTAYTCAVPTGRGPPAVLESPFPYLTDPVTAAIRRRTMYGPNEPHPRQSCSVPIDVSNTLSRKFGRLSGHGPNAILQAGVSPLIVRLCSRAEPIGHVLEQRRR
jgi:hypothetical protein